MSKIMAVPNMRRAAIGTLLGMIPETAAALKVTPALVQKTANEVLLKYSAAECFFCGSKLLDRPENVKKAVPGTPACECLAGGEKAFRAWLLQSRQKQNRIEHMPDWENDIPGLLAKAEEGDLTPETKLFSDKCVEDGCGRVFTITVRHVVAAQSKIPPGGTYRAPKRCRECAVKFRKSKETKPTNTKKTARSKATA